MADVELVVPINLDDLAVTITSNWQVDPDDIMKFILAIEENVADYGFTKTLAKKLTKIYKKENEEFKQGEKDRQDRNLW